MKASFRKLQRRNRRGLLKRKYFLQGCGKNVSLRKRISTIRNNFSSESFHNDDNGNKIDSDEDDFEDAVSSSKSHSKPMKLDPLIKKDDDIESLKDKTRSGLSKKFEEYEVHFQDCTEQQQKSSL